MKFTHCEKAFSNGLRNDWEQVEAIAADAIENGVPIVGQQSIAAAVEASAKSGNEKAASTIAHMALLAKFDHESTARQRRVWRRYGWSTVLVPANGGWSQDDTYDLLVGSLKSWRDVAGAVRGASSPSARGGRKQPLNDEWHAWLGRLGKVMLDGAKLATRTDNEGDAKLDFHSLGAVSLYHRFSEKQIDAELRDLLNSEEVE